MTEGQGSESQRMRGDVELALRTSLDPRRVLPLLHKLARAAEPGSDDHVFAHRQLAEILLERDPWRAAVHARRVTLERPQDDRGWAALGLSQSLLGHYRYAAASFEKALACAPANPWYAHNLGHLLDVALDRPRQAVSHLRSAYRSTGHNREVASSLAHALGRSGARAEARRVLSRAMRKGASREEQALWRWLTDDADGDGEHVPVKLRASPPDTHGWAEESLSGSLPRDGWADQEPEPEPSLAPWSWVDRALARGLARLPLDEPQRRTARTIARDAALRRPPVDAQGAQGLAAAAAYAVVQSARIPLTQAEVAACFRVSVGSLRHRLASVRGRVQVRG